MASCENIWVFIEGASSTGRARGGVEGRQKIVGDAVGQLADDVGRRRRNQQQIDRRRERNMLDIGVGSRLELIGNHPAPGDRLECDRPHESRRRGCHDRDDVVAALLQAARDLDRLVRADPAGHP